MTGSALLGLAVDPLTVAPIGVGCLVGAGVLTFLGVRRRRPPAAPKADRAGDWDAHETSFSDRRSSVRRDGPAVKVLARSNVFRDTASGYVLDRSTGGLKLALSVAVPPGSTLQVRATNAPDTTPWVTVVVRSCRPSGQHQELGCEFDNTPPWNVLLLFG